MKGALLGLLIAACYSPEIPSGAFLCGPKGQCPAGTTCRLGQCVDPSKDGCPDDGREPNDSMAAAVDAPGATEALTLCPYNRDWYHLSIGAGGFRAELDYGSVGGPLGLRAYNAAGALLTAASGTDPLIIDLPTVAAGDYFLHVEAATAGGFNTYSLRTRVPAADLCDHAETLSAATTTLVGTTVGATHDSSNPAGETAFCSTTLGPEVNYRLETLAPVRVSGWVSAAFNWQVYVARGCPVTPGNIVQGVAASTGEGCDGESFALDVNAGTNVLVMDGAEATDAGDYAIALRFDPECTTSADCAADQVCLTGTCTALTGSRYAAADTPLPIVDCKGDTGACTQTPTVSSLEVQESLLLTGFDVRVDLNHTFREDLRIELKPPDPAAAFVLREGCGNCGNDLHAVFPSELPIRDAAAAQALIGTDAAGSWTLTVTDRLNADEGVLTGWSLVLR